jgi:hypothetical protein
MIVPDVRAPAVQVWLRAACAQLSAGPETEEMWAIAAFPHTAWANTP